MKPIITLTGISKSFKGPRGTKVQALHDISLHINEGEFFIFVGASGCGKSTLLRIMSGLEKKYEGQVTYAEGIFHADRSFVFQQFALLPWLTVHQNVEMPLIARGISESERRGAVETELKQFGLEKFGNSFPHELSGGMRQRVGIARALVTNPKILFLDEPFSELDSFTANALRQDLLKIWAERKLTVIMVSHLVPETLELSERIAVMSPRPGRLERIIVNNLSRPRQKRSPEFFAMEDEMYAVIKA